MMSKNQQTRFKFEYIINSDWMKQTNECEVNQNRVAQINKQNLFKGLVGSQILNDRCR